MKLLLHTLMVFAATLVAAGVVALSEPVEVSAPLIEPALPQVVGER